MPELVKEGGDARGQGVAREGAHAQHVTSDDTLAGTWDSALENIGCFDEESTVCVEQDGGIGSCVLLNTGGIGMLEEHFSPGGLGRNNVLRAIADRESEGLESGGGVGVRFAKPGSAGIFGAQNGDDVFAGLLDGQAARTQGQKPQANRILCEDRRGRVAAGCQGTKRSRAPFEFAGTFRKITRDRCRGLPVREGVRGTVLRLCW